jgi:hypothetical protein
MNTTINLIIGIADLLLALFLTVTSERDTFMLLVALAVGAVGVFNIAIWRTRHERP